MNLYWLLGGVPFIIFGALIFYAGQGDGRNPCPSIFWKLWLLIIVPMVVYGVLS